MSPPLQGHFTDSVPFYLRVEMFCWALLERTATGFGTFWLPTAH